MPPPIPIRNATERLWEIADIVDVLQVGGQFMWDKIVELFNSIYGVWVVLLTLVLGSKLTGQNMRNATASLVLASGSSLLAKYFDFSLVGQYGAAVFIFIGVESVLKSVWPSHS
jgi:hypothetical protein